MLSLNCVCGERLDGQDERTLADAVRAHTDRAHAGFALTDEQMAGLLATRVRLSPWDGRPIALTDAPEIRPLTPALREDFLRFFDRDAFMDNPMWADCYCMYFHFEGDRAAWGRTTAAVNRTGIADRIDRGRACGHLAYRDRVVGWVNAAPRRLLPGLAHNEELSAEVDDDGRTGAIVCFVVAAPFRRQGIARRLLEAACAGLREQGMAVAEAYPARTADSDAHVFHGPLSLYLDAGFTPVHETERLTIVRKALDG